MPWQKGSTLIDWIGLDWIGTRFQSWNHGIMVHLRWRVAQKKVVPVARTIGAARRIVAMWNPRKRPHAWLVFFSFSFFLFFPATLGDTAAVFCAYAIRAICARTRTITRFDFCFCFSLSSFRNMRMPRFQMSGKHSAMALAGPAGGRS